MSEVLTHRISQSAQLLRLHQLRVRTSEKRYRDAQKVLNQAQEAVDIRQQAIAEINAQYAAVFEYLANAENSLTIEKLYQAHERRRWLEFDLEKEEFYLDMDITERNEAKNRCDSCKRDWLDARSREMRAQSLVDDSKKGLARFLENQQEIDNEEIFSGGMQ